MNVQEMLLGMISRPKKTDWIIEQLHESYLAACSVGAKLLSLTQI